MANRWENNRISDRLSFLGLQYHCRWWLQPWNEKFLAPWKKSYDQPRQHIKNQRHQKKKKKNQRHHFTNKCPYAFCYGFFSSHVQMGELDHKEGWAPKNWCFQTVVLEKTLESPLDSKDIKPVNPTGNQPWIFIRRTDAKAEEPILWPVACQARLLSLWDSWGKNTGVGCHFLLQIGWLPDAKSIR